jgi:hypothetical protein
MVWDRKRDSLVDNEVPKHEVWREDESPVEREVFAAGAVSPLGTLAHHIDSLGALSNAHSDGGKMALDLCAGLHSQPVFEAACQRRF